MTFKSRIVFDVYPNFDNPLVGQLDDLELSAGIGVATPWKATTKVKRKVTLPFLFGTKTEWRSFRNLISDAGGPLRGFWVPLWITDYPALAHAQGTSTVAMEAIGLANVFQAGNQYAYLALINHQEIECLEIASIDTSTPGQEILTTTAPIAGNFATANTVCCALLYARIAEDGIAHEFLTDGVTRTTIEFVELPQEYVTASPGTKPAFLYELTRGGNRWLLTNYPTMLLVDGEPWAPDNIEQEEIRSAIDFLAEGLKLSIGTDVFDHPGRYALQRNAMEAVTIAIFETDTDSLTYDSAAPIYVGRTGATEFQAQGKIDIEVKSIFRISELAVPRMQVQRTCNHRFCDPNCGVSAASYEIPGTTTDIQDEFVEAIEFGAEATAQGDPQWFALGKVTIGTEVRLITGQVGDRLYISQSFRDATTGDSATALPGCNKRVSHCDGRYNNLIGTLQFPYMPGSNPQFEALALPAKSGGKKG